MNPLQLHSDFVDSLPGESDAHTYPHQVYKSVWSKTSPTPSVTPKLISQNIELTDFMGINSGDSGLAELLTGTTLADGCTPYSMRYGGHQFGNWAGQLGDGRAISLGELHDKEGQHWTLQLKGAGPTPYSREGDGFAVLRSSIPVSYTHLTLPTNREV